MTALSASRDTKRMGDDARIPMIPAPMVATAQVYKGGIAVVTSTGYFNKGITGTGLLAAGVFDQDYLGGASAGAVVGQVRRGTFKFANSSAGDLIAQVDVGTTNCYIVDDQTVAKTNGGATRSLAGKVLAIDADGSVWVEIGL